MIVSQVITNELVKRLKLKSPNARRLVSRRRMFVLSRGDRVDDRHLCLEVGGEDPEVAIAVHKLNGGDAANDSARSVHPVLASY